jgi:thymidine kinase
METTLITGPMKSGKSEKLIELIDECQVPYLVIKPIIDTRDGDKIVSRATERTHRASPIDENNPETTYMLLAALDKVDVLFIDEVQFFSKEYIGELIDDCAMSGCHVVASGLSHDFKGEWFPSTLLLFNESTTIHELTAICELCGCDNATENILVNLYTNEKQYDGDSVQVEGESNVLDYMIICNDCNWNKFDGLRKK